MKRKRLTPAKVSSGRRPGWGRPIFVEFPDDADFLIEKARARVGLDRASFVRSVVMERLAREVEAA